MCEQHKAHSLNEQCNFVLCRLRMFGAETFNNFSVVIVLEPGGNTVQAKASGNMQVAVLLTASDQELDSGKAWERG